MTMTDQDEGEQLRRRLRAMSAVNEQLRAQLTATQDELATAPRQVLAADPFSERAVPVPVGRAPRRAAIASGWLDDIAPPTLGARPFVVEAGDGTFYVVEGDVRRRLRSGLLAMALEAVLGERRPVDDDELASWTDGAPLEVLEGSAGQPFVVLDGRTLPVHGLPLPHPVDQVRVDALAAGPDLDLAEAVMPRRANEASGWIRVLSAAAPSTSRLVIGPDGACWVVEGTMRRAIRSGLLLPSLANLLGDPAPVSDADLHELAEGPAVEILEARVGEPFVVLGGRRSRLVGFPATYPVAQDRADALADGPTLDVAGTARTIQRELTLQTHEADRERARAERKVARIQAQLDDARRAAATRKANPDPRGELQALIDKRGGVVPLLTSTAKRRVRKLLRTARRRG
jgi:hypothetical protein